jgi:hypothetical protein
VGCRRSRNPPLQFLLLVKTVGVMGDGRTYEYVVGLRAVTSTDGMTADFYSFDMKFLGATATRIINEVKGVSQVVYDIRNRRGRLSGSRGDHLGFRNESNMSSRARSLARCSCRRSIHSSCCWSAWEF